MVFETLLESIPDIDLFQIVQTSATTVRVRVRVRVRAAAGADQDRLWEAVRRRLAGLRTAHQVDAVGIEHAREPPAQTPGGKYRVVIPRS